MPGICLAYDWHTVDAGRSVALAARAWQDSLAYAWQYAYGILVPVFLRLFTLEVAYAGHMPPLWPGKLSKK